MTPPTRLLCLDRRGRRSLELLLTAVFVSMIALPAAAQTYTVRRLGPADAMRSSATAINNAGQVLGQLQDSSGDLRTFVYSDETLEVLRTLGGRMSQAYRINEAGEVVGYSQTAEGEYRAFRYANGVMTDLGTWGGSFSAAMGINASGRVVAYADMAAQHMTRGVLQDGTTAWDLGTFEGRVDVVDINDVGHVVGHHYPDHHGGFRRAFVYDGGMVRFFGTIRDEAITVTDVNEGGEVVGHLGTARGALRAFVFRAGAIAHLGNFAGGTQSLAFALNDRGQIVGAADTGRGGLQAVLYSRGALHNLNDLIPKGSGWMLSAARGINDRGQIVGEGLLNGKQEAFLLTPD